MKPTLGGWGARISATDFSTLYRDPWAIEEPDPMPDDPGEWTTLGEILAALTAR